jgi:FixJ family two-component response regulator
MSQPAIRVAIVDDDSSVRKALARLLAAHSFETKTYESASDFLKSVASSAPECLVLDLHMPDITGLDLQRYLRRTGIKIPTVVITAYDEPGIRERCYSAGAAAFLVKPLSSVTLIGAINAATGRT